MRNKNQVNTQMVTVNVVRIACEIHGTGEIPIAMVHGSWFSRQNWDSVVPRLAESFRVITYDRRGHGESERPSGQGSVREDVADLAALIEHLGIAPRVGGWAVLRCLNNASVGRRTPRPPPRHSRSRAAALLAGCRRLYLSPDARGFCSNKCQSC